jgi:uncharacterized protein (TIGR01777 family)
MSENQTNTNLSQRSSVLISGGSGLVGRYLTSVLLSEGYKVSHLSRKAGSIGKVRVYRWDPEKNIIDPQVFEGVDFLIHLAGTNLGENRWTKKRKEEILTSRVDSSRLLYKVITDNRIGLKAFISASAIGYYGSVTSEKIFKEDDIAGEDFLGTTCKKWEEAADMFAVSGIRTVKIRTAVVLEKSDSALSKLMKPARFGFLVQPGNGRQYMPWIHIYDLCNIYLKVISDSEMTGAYNAVAPQHVTGREFIQTLANVMKSHVLPIAVPAIVLSCVLGEMSDVILKGSRASSDKIVNAGYNFIFSNLHDALSNVINS